MNLLALDTSTLRSVVALGLDDGRALVREAEPGPKHGRLLVPAIRELLARAGLGPRDLGGVAVGLGPGSFTGLRVGVTAAKALAYAVGCPLVGLSSLEAIARNAPADRLRVVAAIDAQRGDLFSARFRRDEAGGRLRREGPDRLLSAEEWAAGLPAGAYVLCPSADRIAAALPPHAELGPIDRARPVGTVLLELAAEAVADGRFADVWALEPCYLRRSAAEEARDAPAP